MQLVTKEKKLFIFACNITYYNIYYATLDTDLYTTKYHKHIKTKSCVEQNFDTALTYIYIYITTSSSHDRAKVLRDWVLHRGSAHRES